MKRYKILKKGGSTAPQAWTSPGPNSRQFPIYYPGSEWSEPDVETRSTLQPVDPEDATLEAELGETVFVPDVAGLPAHFKVGGTRHSQSGTPLDVPENSFVFSDTRDMRIGGKILKHFGKSEDTKKKFTPADLAKKYDINKFRKTLADPDSDDYQRDTAEMMIANYNKKLGMLALVQESQKGFPSGIPQVAMPYLITAAVEPDQILPLKGTPGQEMMQPGASNEAGMMKYGGNWFDGNGYQYGGNLPKAQYGPPAEESSWYDKPLHVAGEALTAIPKSMSYLSQYVPYTATGFDPQYKPRYESLGDNFNRMQTMQGIDPFSGDTLTPGIPLTPKEKFIFDTAADPQSVIGVSGSARTVGQGILNAGKAANYVKGLSQKAILELMDIFKTKDIKTLIKYIAKNADEVIGRAAPAISRFDDQPAPVQYKQQESSQELPSYKQYIKKYGGSLPKAQTGNNPGKPILTRTKEGKLFKYPNGDWVLIGPDNRTVVDKGTSRSVQPQTPYNIPQMTLPDQSVVSSAKKQATKTAAKSSGKAAPIGEIDPYDPVAQYLDLGDDQTMYGYGVAKKQARNPKGGYGKQDFESFKTNNKEILERFKREHNGREYSKSSKPNDDTRWYQEAHWEQTYQDGLKAGYPPELARNMANGLSFTGDDDSSVRSIDAKHGDWTNSRVRFKFKPYQKAAQESPVNKGWNIPSPDYNQAAADAPWWLQDVIKTAGAAGDFLRLKKYLPWAPKLAPYVPETTFYDPTRELAANSEQMAIGTQGAGVFAGPPQFSSRFSGIQGTGAKNAADILGKYNNMNVQTANVAGAQKADIYNKANEFNAKTALDLYDKTTLANQNYDNSKNMARQELRQGYIDAITNKWQTDTLNKLHPYWQVDPSVGGRSYLGNTAGMYDGKGYDTDNGEAWVRKWMSEGMSPKEAWDAWNQMNGSTANLADARTERLERQNQSYDLRNSYRNPYKRD